MEEVVESRYGIVVESGEREGAHWKAVAGKRAGATGRADRPTNSVRVIVDARRERAERAERAGGRAGMLRRR